MVARGDVYWVGLDKRRPCIIVSSSAVLDVDVWQTHVVALTSNRERGGLVGNVLLNSRRTGLPSSVLAL